MIQNTIKVLTIGFFISMISGFVIYRMGYFDDATSSNSLQTSPNGGELLIANVDQDSTKSPKVTQQTRERIMPSSKSAVPIFDAQQVPERTEILPSSKSLILPIEIKPTPNEVAEKAREAYKVQPEIEVKTQDTFAREEQPKQEESKVISNQIDVADEPVQEIETPKGISWGTIGLGVLGILFVAVGSIVYFKRKS